MRLLLINPKFPENFWTSKWAITKVLPNKRTMVPPLGLATLAALCPPHWEVEIVDENIETIPLEPRADIVGVCGMGGQFPRQRELLTYYRSRGYYVVAGGSYASLCPEHYVGLVDTVAAGECEYIWKEFCRDFEQGNPKSLYLETRTVTLLDSPTPRFDLLRLNQYTCAPLQFSRGCPFRCEFCDIIVMFGRKPRAKSLDQIERELDELRRLNIRSVLFVDDNLIGNLPLARRLLDFLKEYQAKHEYRFGFIAELTLNLAQHDDLLQKFRDANFSAVFIGIESTDPASLKETLKVQNLHGDILTSVRRIYSYGLDVMGGFIIGFDHDTADTFERQYQFITEAGIMFPMIALLTALPKTPLHERLRKDGRLTTLDDVNVMTQVNTNVIPKGMPYQVMVDGYVALYQRLLSDRAIAERIYNQVRHLKAPNYGGGYSLKQGIGILWRLIWRGIVPGGPVRIWHFLCTLPWLTPSHLPTVAADWVGALSMKEFADRCLTTGPVDRASMERLVDRMRDAVDPHIDAGNVTFMLSRSGNADLDICLKGPLDNRFFKCTGSGLRRLLRHTPATVTLQVDFLQLEQLKNFQGLLHQVASYGDRVRIIIHEDLRALVPIDSSVFNLVLGQSVGASRHSLRSDIDSKLEAAVR